MNPVIIIPARYASSRFPGKSLAVIRGKSLLKRVWEKAIQALPQNQVFVATDDQRIAVHCREQQIQFVKTSLDCMTGTDRVCEAARQIEAGLYINLQGDEPLVRPDDIRKVIEAAKKMPDRVVNAMAPIDSEADFRSTSVPKVVATPEGRLLYISRAAIPADKQLGFQRGMRQVCIYALPKPLLTRFGAVKGRTPLESVEDIEILRFLELGIEVQMVEVSGGSIAVDLPEDVARVEKLL